MPLTESLGPLSSPLLPKDNSKHLLAAPSFDERDVSKAAARDAIKEVASSSQAPDLSEDHQMSAGPEPTIQLKPKHQQLRKKSNRIVPDVISTSHPPMAAVGTTQTHPQVSEDVAEVGDDQLDDAATVDADAEADADGRSSIIDDQSALAFWDDLSIPSPAIDAEDRNLLDVLTSQFNSTDNSALMNTSNDSSSKYLEDFEIVIPDHEVLIGSIPLEEIQKREETLEQARLERAQMENELFARRELMFQRKEKILRDKLNQEALEKQQELTNKQIQLFEWMQLRSKTFGFLFDKAENHFRRQLVKQKALVKKLYGELQPLTHQGDPQQTQRLHGGQQNYRVAWQQVPMTLKIRARVFKAVKDKLPRGHYVVVATLYDRLGGHALKYSAMPLPTMSGTTSTSKSNADKTRGKPKEPKNKLKPSLTRPFFHGGKFYHTNLLVEQNLFVVCPPEVQIRPANVIIFELFRLGQVIKHRIPQPSPPKAKPSTSSPSPSSPLSHAKQQQANQLPPYVAIHHLQDQVIGWAAMPLSTPDFEIVQGKFRLPVLKGEVDHSLDKFQAIEEMIRDDLSCWLCNFYFQITHLEKLNGRNPAFAMQMDQRTQMLHFPQVESKRKARTPASSSPHREQNDDQELTGATKSLGSPFGRHSKFSRVVEDNEEEKDHETDHAARRRSWRGFLNRRNPKTSNKKKTSKVCSGEFPMESCDGEQSAKESQQDLRQRRTKAVKQPMGSSPAEDVHPTDYEQSQQASQDKNKDKNSDDEDQEEGGEEEGDFDDSDEDEDDEDDTHDRQKRNSSRHPIPSAQLSLDLENYKFSVNKEFAIETVHQKRFHATRKLHYLRHELFIDLGISKVFTMEFWLMMVLLLLTCWLRVFIHYLGQWLFLRGLKYPVYQMEFHVTTCLVKYTWKSIPTSIEVLLIAMGTFANFAVFLGFALAGFVSQRVVGELPAFASKFVACMGLASLLDPLLIFLIDLVWQRFRCAPSSISTSSLSALSNSTGIMGFGNSTSIGSSTVSPLSSTSTSATCDCIEADAFKLFYRFASTEGSGIVGLFMTLIVYSLLICFVGFGLYWYLLHVHMNGRMLDGYRRIHGHDQLFFLPLDNEISSPELEMICAAAQTFKSFQGTQRRVFITKVQLQHTVESDLARSANSASAAQAAGPTATPTAAPIGNALLQPQATTPAMMTTTTETSLHIAIYNVELNGSKQLYRHFLQSSDGSIMELFGDVLHQGGNSRAGKVYSASIQSTIQEITQQTDAQASASVLVEQETSKAAQVWKDVL